MPSKRHKLEEIVAKLRQVDVLTAQGTLVAVLRADIMDLSPRSAELDDAPVLMPLVNDADGGMPLSI